jgi:DNA invertase Pin-like site-specific DNA recombinase
MRNDNHREELRKLYTKEEDATEARFIPAKEKVDIFGSNHIFKVCAYCRVSTDNEEQLSSFELQQQHYRQLAGKHENWDLREIFADEGISGTSLKNRDQFNEMISRCKAGEFDLIVTKSVSRFARNLVDCVSLVRQLRTHNPPIGVFFETDSLFTLSEESELKLSMLATFAQEESVKKSESMNWSLRERFKNKKLLTPELFGYTRPRDAVGNYVKYGKLEINEEEADVVRFIYDAFLAGYSLEGIATILTDIGVPTKLGNTVWNIGSVSYILRNERYCGSVLTWKTFTADIFEHKKRRNNKDRDQYLYMNEHPPIIPIEKYDAVQRLFGDRRHGMRGGLHIMQVIDMGVFQGYVPINHHWINDSPDAYFEASDSVREVKAPQRFKRSYFSAFDLSGYQVVRGQFLTARTELPCITFTSEKITFNPSCTRKMEAKYIQLLLHPSERKIAIRPCREHDSFSISWQRYEDHLISTKMLSSPHFCAALYQIMDWNPDYSYRILGTYIAKGSEQIMIFNLVNAMPSAVIPPEKGEERKRSRRMAVCPEEWGDSFGEEFYDFSMDNSLYYAPVAGSWNTGEKSKAVSGQYQFNLLSSGEVLESAEKIKSKVDSTE